MGWRSSSSSSPQSSSRPVDRSPRVKRPSRREACAPPSRRRPSWSRPMCASTATRPARRRRAREAQRLRLHGVPRRGRPALVLRGRTAPTAYRTWFARARPSTRSPRPARTSPATACRRARSATTSPATRRTGRVSDPELNTVNYGGTLAAQHARPGTRPAPRCTGLSRQPARQRLGRRQHLAQRLPRQQPERRRHAVANALRALPQHPEQRDHVRSRRASPNGAGTADHLPPSFHGNGPSTSTRRFRSQCFGCH